MSKSVLTATYEVCCWCTGAADRAQPNGRVPSSFLRLSQSQACQTRTHATAADPPTSRPTTENTAAANGCTRTSDKENTGTVRSLLSSYASQSVRKSGHHSIDPRTAINLHHSKHAAHHERPAQQNEQGARLANSISYFNLTQPQKQNKSNSLTLQVRKFSSSIKNRRSYNNHPNAEENHLVHRNTRIASKPPVQTHPSKQGYFELAYQAISPHSRPWATNLSRSSFIILFQSFMVFLLVIGASRYHHLRVPLSASSFSPTAPNLQHYF